MGPAWRTTLQPSHLLAIALALGCMSCGDCVRRPSLSSISPTSVTAGSAGPQLTVKGDDFQPNSSVEWNGSVRPTTFVNSHELIAAISAPDVATAGSVQVTVFTPPQVQPVTFMTGNPSPGGGTVNLDCAGGTSSSAMFTINP